jgi:hypothetical protein
MNWSIDFAPLFPPILLWTGCAIALALVVLLLLRHTRGALFRALALGAILLALANPTLRQEERDKLTNVAIVVLDESASQSLEKRQTASTALREQLEERLARIPNLETKWVTGARPSDGAPRGTQLFGDLNNALKDTPPDRLAGVIIVTDGQVHDVPKGVKELGFNAPVHALLTGKQNEFDRRIEVLTAPRYGIVGQKRMIELRVRESGKAPTRLEKTVTLRIRRSGQPDAFKQTLIGSSVEIEMAFPHAGTNIVEIELDAADGELTTANNRAVISAEGVRENLRVLLVSGEPHAGERTWRNLLKSDAAVDLVHFTILRPPQKQDGTPINELSLIAFPTRELFSEKIKDFDLIIFDHYENRGILRRSYFGNISRFVAEHGGALLVAAGDDYSGRSSLYRTPLAPVLPGIPTGKVITKPFKAKVTEDGFRHPVTRDLQGAGDGSSASEPSWGRWFRQVAVRTDRGRTLMNGADDNPLLILDRKNDGRVALLTSDHAWLWARGFDGGGPHTDLLRRLAHWLMKEPDLEEERLIASARGLKLSLERFSMQKAVDPVTLLGPGGNTQTVELEPKGDGLWRAAIDVKLPGLYKAETTAPDGKLTAVAHAGKDDPREMSEVVATAGVLKPLSDKTGGGVVWTRNDTASNSGDAGTNSDNTTVDVTAPRITMLQSAKVLAGNGWIGLRDQEAFVTRGIALMPLFNGLIALALLLSLLALAWWREGR